MAGSGVIIEWVGVTSLKLQVNAQPDIVGTRRVLNEKQEVGSKTCKLNYGKTLCPGTTTVDVQHLLQIVTVTVLKLEILPPVIIDYP